MASKALFLKPIFRLNWVILPQFGRILGLLQNGTTLWGCEINARGHPYMTSALRGKGG